MFSLRYTLCFCRQGDRLLMLLRRKPPHAGQWNGVGGKIEPGEPPNACVRREVLEETCIDLVHARTVRFGGVVTWPHDSSDGQGAGMYVYTATFIDPVVTWEGDRVVPDGCLRWQPISHVCDRRNAAVVANIAYFLPPMLEGAAPREYYCDFRGDILQSVEARALSPSAHQDDPAYNQEHADKALRRHRHFRQPEEPQLIPE